MYTKVICPGCKRDYTEDANDYEWNSDEVGGKWRCLYCHVCREIPDWLSRNSSIQEAIEAFGPDILEAFEDEIEYPMGNHDVDLDEICRNTAKYAPRVLIDDEPTELERLQAELDKYKGLHSMAKGRLNVAHEYQVHLEADIRKLRKQSRERLGEVE